MTRSITLPETTALTDLMVHETAEAVRVLPEHLTQAYEGLTLRVRGRSLGRVWAVTMKETASDPMDGAPRFQVVTVGGTASRSDGTVEAFAARPDVTWSTPGRAHRRFSEAGRGADDELLLLTTLTVTPESAPDLADALCRFDCPTSGATQSIRIVTVTPL